MKAHTFETALQSRSFELVWTAIQNACHCTKTRRSQNALGFNPHITEERESSATRPVWNRLKSLEIRISLITTENHLLMETPSDYSKLVNVRL